MSALNDHQNTKCKVCGKLGHPESRCFKNNKDNDKEVNVIIGDDEPVVTSIKSAVTGESFSKQARPDGVIPISSPLISGVGVRT